MKFKLFGRCHYCCLLYSIVFASFNHIIAGVPPVWWSTGAPPVIDPHAPSNNYAPANIGQAKWMAKSALDALRAIWPSVADQIEVDLVGEGKPIATWAAPILQQQKDMQRAPLVIGQLKAISAPFYTHLNSAAPNWLAGERAAYFMPDTGTYFPWTATGDDDSNKSLALIGQLKAVYSLDFFADRETGSAADGLPDLWEYRRFGNLSYGALDDPDGNGLTNAQEYGWERYWYGHPNNSNNSGGSSNLGCVIFIPNEGHYIVDGVDKTLNQF